MKKLILILTLAAFAAGPLMAVETAPQAPTAQKVAGKKHKKKARKHGKKHKKGHKPGKTL